MTTVQSSEIAALELRSVRLSGAQVLGAMAEQGFGPAQLNIFPGGRFISAAVLSAEINSDPTAASVIAVQLQVAPAAVAQNVPAADAPETQQRSRLLALLQRYARYDPTLARDPQFWAAMSSARNGAALTPSQQKALGQAWAKRARSFGGQAWRHSARDSRTFMRALTIPAAFRHNSYLTTMVLPPVVAYDRRIVLGEDFEGKLFDKLWPQPAAPEIAVEQQHAKPRPLKWSHKRVMKVADGEISANEFASRPVFNPTLTPNFTDTDSGDEG